MAYPNINNLLKDGEIFISNHARERIAHKNLTDEEIIEMVRSSVKEKLDANMLRYKNWKYRGRQENTFYRRFNEYILVIKAVNIDNDPDRLGVIVVTIHNQAS